MKSSKKKNQNADYSSVLKAYDEAIGHYDFVLNDLSSEIYDPILQAQKEPVIAFLKKMREQWKDCRADVQRQIDQMG